MPKDFFNPHNLGGDCLAIEEDLRLGTPTAVFGVSDAYKALLAAACTTGRVVYVTDSAPNAARMAAEIAAFAGEEVALLCAKDEVLLYKEAVSKDALFRRLTALRKVRKGTRLVVADVESLLQLFPDDVPPDTIVFLRSFTIAFNSNAPSCGMLEKDSSLSKVRRSFLNLRMDITVPQRLMGGMVACTREPSGSLASKSGWRSSRILSTDFAMFAAAAVSWASPANLADVSSSLPRRSTYI